MTRRRMALMILVGMMLASSEVMAQEKLAYVCYEPGSNFTTIGFCVADADGQNAAFLSFAGFDLELDSHPGNPFEVSADGTAILLNSSDCIGIGSSSPSEECIYRLPIDGSPVTQIDVSIPTAHSYYPVSFVAPPSVATLSPTNQTISVFLLGMIASALIMRGKERTAGQT